jgi:hypothetical protein
MHAIYMEDNIMHSSLYDVIDHVSDLITNVDLEEEEYIPSVVVDPKSLKLLEIIRQCSEWEDTEWLESDFRRK